MQKNWYSCRALWAIDTTTWFLGLLACKNNVEKSCAREDPECFASQTGYSGGSPDQNIGIQAGREGQGREGSEGSRLY